MVPLVPLGLRLPLLPPCVRVAGHSDDELPELLELSKLLEVELLADDIDRLRRRFLAGDLLFEGCWRAPFEVAGSVLIALSSGECNKHPS